MNAHVACAVLAGALLGATVALVVDAEPAPSCVGEMRAGETTPPVRYEDGEP